MIDWDERMRQRAAVRAFRERYESQRVEDHFERAEAIMLDRREYQRQRWLDLHGLRKKSGRT